MLHPITFDSDHALAVHGVAGRLTHRTKSPAEARDVWTRQRWISEARPIAGYGADATMRVELRFDDECGNGHNTFAITAEVRRPKARDVEACGCMHEDIARVFPELAALIPWHLTSSDGPMHYIANTVYLAGDRDYNGLRKGEVRQIRNGRTGQLAWRRPGAQTEYRDADTCPTDAPLVLAWEPWNRIGEGKDRELDAARRAAVWPEATDEELSVEPEILRAALEARAADVLARFREAMEGAGFVWAPSEMREGRQA